MPLPPDFDPTQGLRAVKSVQRALLRSLTAATEAERAHHRARARDRLTAFAALLDAQDAFEREAWNMGSTSVAALRRHVAQALSDAQRAEEEGEMEGDEDRASEDAFGEEGAEPREERAPWDALAAEGDANRALVASLQAQGPWRVEVRRLFETPFWLSGVEIALDGPAGPHTLYAWDGGPPRGPTALGDAHLSWRPFAASHPKRPAIGGALIAEGLEGTCHLYGALFTLEPRGRALAPAEALPPPGEAPTPEGEIALLRALLQHMADAIEAGEGAGAQVPLAQLRAGLRAFTPAIRGALPPAEGPHSTDPLQTLARFAEARNCEEDAHRLWARAVHQAAHFAVSYALFHDESDPRFPLGAMTQGLDLTGAEPPLCAHLDTGDGEELAALAGIIAEAWILGAEGAAHRDARPPCYGHALGIVEAEAPAALPWADAAARTLALWGPILGLARALLDQGALTQEDGAAHLEALKGDGGDPAQRGAAWIQALRERRRGRMAEIRRHATWDYQLASSPKGWPGLTLAIDGSNDFSYYTSTTLRLWGVRGLDLPTHFSHADVSLGEPGDAAPALGPLPPWTTVIQLRAEAGGSSEALHQIACDAFTFEVHPEGRRPSPGDSHGVTPRGEGGVPWELLAPLMPGPEAKEAPPLSVDIAGGLRWLREAALPPPPPLDLALEGAGGAAPREGAMRALWSLREVAEARSHKAPGADAPPGTSGWLRRLGRWMGHLGQGGAHREDPLGEPVGAPLGARDLLVAFRQALEEARGASWAPERPGAAPASLAPEPLLEGLLSLLSLRCPLVNLPTALPLGTLVDGHLAGPGADALQTQWRRRRAQAQLGDLHALLFAPPTSGPLAEHLGRVAAGLRATPGLKEALERDRQAVTAAESGPPLAAEAAYQAGRILALHALGHPHGSALIDPRFLQIPRLLSDPQAEAALSEDERIAHYAGVEARSWGGDQGPTGDWTDLLPDPANRARGQAARAALSAGRPQVEMLTRALAERGRLDAIEVRLLLQGGDGATGALMAWRLLGIVGWPLGQ